MSALHLEPVFQFFPSERERVAVALYIKFRDVAQLPSNQKLGWPDR